MLSWEAMKDVQARQHPVVENQLHQRYRPTDELQSFNSLLAVPKQWVQLSYVNDEQVAPVAVALPPCTAPVIASDRAAMNVLSNVNKLGSLSC